MLLDPALVTAQSDAFDLPEVAQDDAPALAAPARPTTALTVSVVIAAFSDERYDDLQACVASVAAQNVPAHETVVVIDHNPALLERVRTELPGVIAIANSGNRGASCARNSGVAVATGEIVAFLDDDAQAAPVWIEELVAAYSGDDVVGVGGAIEPNWTSARPDWFPDEFDWVVGCTYRGMPEVPAPVRNLIAANMSMRKSAFDAVGGFRTDFGKRGKRSEPEETELCIRVGERYPQGRWMYHPPARVTHRVPAGRTRPGYFAERCVNEGLGKARMVAYAGTGRGLSAESAYATRVLPRGIRRELGVAVRGDLNGLLRALSIAGGLALTTAAYAGGLVRYGRAPRQLG